MIEIVLTLAAVGIVAALSVAAASMVMSAQEENNSIISDAMTWRITGPASQGGGVWTFPEPMPAGRKRRAIISLYECLDKKADRFVDRKYGRRLGITFEQYAACSDFYDAKAQAMEEALKNGDGINVFANVARIVPLKRGNAAA
ncbi:hypothetical protein [Desulfatibacillum aliphaticivorans]|uniref:hypothetical protein n=1 Tax=Desulfatibacillum aliphaticivorans TaxID=218208 RepID=UPI000408121A|nr:hypothetical protein [Desulfatibacillum aliphaticivorans]